MKKLVLLTLCLILLISGCSKIEESLREPVDPNDTTMVEVVVNEGDSWSMVAEQLSDLELIASKGTLTGYVKEMNMQDALSVGTHQVSKSMNIEQIAAALSISVEGKEVVTITFQEGLTSEEIAALLQENGIISKEDFFKGIETLDLEYSFLEGVSRENHLEGFLFPDTYEFYAQSDAATVLSKFLDRFARSWTEEYQKKASEWKMNAKQVMTLASIIEREARVRDEFFTISGIFHNRLDQDMKLQACSTVQYLLGERKPVLTLDDIAIESDYNTYLHEGLPPAPIANPGDLAIQAALFPEKSDYLYFVVDDPEVGNHLFAKSYEDHLKNIDKSLAYDEPLE